ncbi:hypothetical protein RFI_36296, partial [Reticulomyxa filosa]
EWLAAYYLVRCLYESNESKEHEQVCSTLKNEQLTPRYSVMIPFICGMLYNNIISKKDPSGSGLLYFWKLLHSSPQIVPIHRILGRPLNKVMESHLPNFQYVLHHPDIHLDRLKLLQYLCISTEASDIVVQCCKQVFKRYYLMCSDLLCVISVKPNEQQLDDIIQFFMDGLVDKDKNIHEECAESIVKIALKLNERQLNK